MIRVHAARPARSLQRSAITQSHAASAEQEGQESNEQYAEGEKQAVSTDAQPWADEYDALLLSSFFQFL